MTGYEEGGGEGIKNIQASDLSICIVGEKLLLIFSKATVARKGTILKDAARYKKNQVLKS